MSAQTSETLNAEIGRAGQRSVGPAGAAPAAESLNEHDQSFYEKDVLSQFRANLNQLEDLNSRLHFMMNEVAGLVKKK
jgi:hypothetical protein